jgi:glucose/mannose transport system substrate-binding protein
MFYSKRLIPLFSLLALLALVLAACGAPGATTQPTTAPVAPTDALAVPTDALAPATEIPLETATEAATTAATETTAETATASTVETATAAIAETATMAADETSTGASSTSPVSGKFEIFSWWTNGGEADGLNAMFEVYKQQNPDVEIVNATVAGGAGTNAKTVLKTRMQGGQAPDTFQVHAGQELIGTWVVADKMEPLTALFKEQGWDKVMPKLLLDQISYNGEIYSVPVNIHRSNMMWYNPKIFADNSLQPPKTLDEFFTVAEALKAKGITPLAVGGKDKFEAPHLFESVLLATFGVSDYPKLFQDPFDMWADERTATAIETMNRMLSYANADRTAKGWSDAAQDVLDGKAAMTIMGDWAEGFFLSKQATPGTDFGWAPAPGTDGAFMWLSDSFGLPKGAPNRDAAIAWLKVAGSKEGQDAFNPKKGSIPARTDADKSLYDEYLKSSIDAFGTNQLAPSIVHGAAANEAFMTSFGNALNVFSSDLDIDSLTVALEESVTELSQ